MDDVSAWIASVMAGLTFFRQKRLDGGVRTGLMLGETSVLETFEEGQDEYEPTLIWSVDLRCSGPELPATAEEARQWLLNHEAVIRDGFRRFADELSAGSDPTGTYLLQWSGFPSTPAGVEMKIVCGALRRVDARFLAEIITDMGNHWKEYVLSLSSREPALP